MSLNQRGYGGVTPKRPAPATRQDETAPPESRPVEQSAATAAPSRIDNDAFFGDRFRARGPTSIPEDEFYVSPRPPAEMDLATRTALTPLRFSLILFLVGWSGILFQRSFLRQIVFGAPVFEEMAKAGLALLLVALLRLPWLPVRVLLGLASGAAFGVFEHWITYAEEDAWSYANRIVFHAATGGLSLAFYSAFDAMGDVRTRWASTVVPTLLHWANNFAALMLGFLAFLLPVAITLATLWSVAVSAAGALLCLVALATPGRFRERSRTLLQRVMPRLGIQKAEEPPAPPPPSDQT